MKKYKPKMPIIIPNQTFYNQQSRWYGNDDARQKEEESKQIENRNILGQRKILPKK